MALSDFFGGGAKPAPAPQQTTPAPSANPDTSPSNLAAAQSMSTEQTIAATSTAPADNSAPAPLADFTDLWKNSAPEGDQANANQELTLPDEAMAAVLEKLDFAQTIPAELNQRLQQGDNTAIPEMLNHVSKQSYETAMRHMAAVTNQHLKNKASADASSLDTAIQSKLTSESVSNLPNADNPIIRRELDRVSQQLRTKFPDASSSWVAQQSQRYITELGAAFTPASSTPQGDTSNPVDVDFADFLQ